MQVFRLKSALVTPEAAQTPKSKSDFFHEYCIHLVSWKERIVKAGEERGKFLIVFVVERSHASEGTVFHGIERSGGFSTRRARTRRAFPASTVRRTARIRNCSTHQLSVFLHPLNIERSARAVKTFGVEPEGRARGRPVSAFAEGRSRVGTKARGCVVGT